MTSIEDLISQITSKTTKNITALQKTLEAALNHNLNTNASHLQRISPKLHSLGYMYLLFGMKEKNGFVEGVEYLVRDMNLEQIRKGIFRFGQIMHIYAARLREAKQYERCLRILQFVIETIRPSPEHLTPFHADYLMICLKAKNFRLASRLVDQKILDIEPELTGLTPTDMLLYYFYGGNVYVGLKQFVKAERFYDTGLTVPAFAQSAIMVEIFKRFVLVQLLNYGKFLGINKNASNIVHKHMKTFCSSYIDFANAFTEGDAEALKNVAKEKQKEFAEDKNMGIINQCIEALSRRNIQKLTATYLTLSLDALAQHTNLANAREAELILLRMIDHGEIAARINHKDGMVIFQEEQENLNITDRVNYQINQCMTLAQKLKSMDDTLASSHPYLARKNGIREDVFGPKSTEGKTSKFGRVLDMFSK